VFDSSGKTTGWIGRPYCILPHQRLCTTRLLSYALHGTASRRTRHHRPRTQEDGPRVDCGSGLLRELARVRLESPQVAPHGATVREQGPRGEEQRGLESENRKGQPTESPQPLVEGMASNPFDNDYW
jgi:hypothetical protein